jgi:carboxylesterase type B
MLRSLILPVIAVVFALFGSAGVTNDAVRVFGGLISFSVVDGARIYKSIPFAATPVSELRRKAPQPVSAWDGVRKCDDFGPDCPQAPYPQSSLHYSAPQKQSEDCLYSSFVLPMPTWARMPATGRSKAHLYFFGLVPRKPMTGLRAPHTMGIPFVFNHIDLCESMVGRTNPVMRELEAASAGALASLARAGDPNHKGLPNWPAYAPQKRAVMIFDSPCRVENDPTGEIRRIMEKRGGVGVAGPTPAPGAWQPISYAMRHAA